jgi:hypothetical protein
MRTTERGASPIPFIITLVLLLGFVFLWFDQKGEADKLRDENAGLTKKIKGDGKAERGFEVQLDDWRQYGANISAVVGFRTLTLPGETVAVSKPEDVADQMNAQKDGTALSEIAKASVVQIAGAAWKPKTGAAGTPTQVPMLPQDFKDKVREVRDAHPGNPPTAPTDTDDAAAVAAYNAAKADWEAKLKKYSDLLDALVKMPPYKDYSAVVGVTGLYDPDKTTTLVWSFWDRPASALPTVEEFFKIPQPILRAYKAALADLASADITQREGLEKQLAEVRKQNDNADEAALGLQQQLLKEQTAHSDDMKNRQAEIAQLRADLEKKTVSETGALAALAKEKEDRKKDQEKSTQTITAYENRVREDKEKRDLEIERNDPDGHLLSADAALATGYIDLGSADKVYPGLVFDVSAIGRGAQRYTKGTVVVSRVLDSHYSQVRIVSQMATFTPGDMVANPFYSKSKPIHMYLAGDLVKYPKAIAVARLKQMGVLVDENVNSKTDWILVPDAVAASAGGPAPAEGAPKEESQYDRLKQMAKDYGAALVTERMVEHFLGY